MSQRKRPKIVIVDTSTEEKPVEREAASPKPPKVVELPPNDPVEETHRTSPKKKRKPSLVLTIVLAVMAMTVLAAFVFIPVKPPEKVEPPKVRKPLPACLGIQPDVDWIYEYEQLECQKGAMDDELGLADLLLSKNVDYKKVIQVLELAAQRNMPSIKPGNPYILLYGQENLQSPAAFVYESGPSAYVMMNLQGELAVHYHQRNIIRRERKELNVIIQTTLADAMYNRNSGLRLTRALESAIKYKVDMFHLHPGDRFQLLYNETHYEGGRTEVGSLLAVHYKQGGQEGYAFAYNDAYSNGFFDMDGLALKSGFLMAPLEYGRISSPYDVNRPDPVSKSGKVMPHLGTDYAAPKGTPILAVGEGVVLKAEFKGGNGNYVKLKHSEAIQTQYLHMSRFGEGIEPGVFVRQGQVIGYVGSTGRSTGPHVCFRYWKNGKQVDHRKEEDFGIPAGLPKESLEAFKMHRDTLLRLMTDI